MDENAKLKASTTATESHVENLKSELSKKADDTERKANAIASERADADTAKQHAKALQAQIDELKTNHDKEASILASRIGTQSSQRLETFKHDLARVLRVDYVD